MRVVIWVGSSKKELLDTPEFIRKSFGHQLWEVQKGDAPLDMKPMPQLGRGVYELRDSFDTNAYRLMYVVNLKKGIYVLDVFMKKSKSGIGLPKPDIERIQTRFKNAVAMDEGN